MVDLDATIVDLLDSNSVDSQKTEKVVDLILEKIRKDELKIKDLVIKLNPLLTAGNHELRFQGVDLLSQVITHTEKSRFNEKEIEVLTEYLSNRLGDHNAMHEPVLKSLSYFVDCEYKSPNYNRDLLESLKLNSNVQNMTANNRLLVYKILRSVITERQQENSAMDSDLFYSFIHLIEGESEPDNLMICFYTVSYTMKNFSNLEPFIDDMFEWLASYYPLDYTPDNRKSTTGPVIQKSDLTRALYDCFYASSLNADNLQTLMLEKIDSNQLTSTKVESLKCLIKFYELFPSVEVKDYATTLWTSIRTNCLMRVNLVDPTLLVTCYDALSTMTKRLSDDRYITFISDMYDELSIAIRKPEMDLFEPAARLIAHAIKPRIVGFNFVLAKILPSSMKAIATCELRPASGLSYIFGLLASHHPGVKLIPELDQSVDELTIQAATHAAANQDCSKLLDSILRYRVEIGDINLDEVKEKLLSSLNQSNVGSDEGSALICANRSKADVPSDDIKSDSQIDSFVEIVKNFQLDGTSSEFAKSVLTRFSIYLRLLVLQLDETDCSSLMREILKLLSAHRDNIKIGQESRNEYLISILYECVECLIASKCSGDISGFLGSLIELNLFYAREAQTMQIRRRALTCMSIISKSFQESQLLILRQSVVDRLKKCLADKKRIVRQAAVDARLKWFLIGQPVGF